MSLELKDLNGQGIGCVPHQEVPCFVAQHAVPEVWKDALEFIREEVEETRGG